MAIEDFEQLKISEFINVTAFGWSPPTLVADFGAGYGAGAVVAPYGLRRWTLQADVLPDSDDYPIDYEVDGDPYTASRFSYFLDFFQRHLLLGNKPFIIRDPRTEKKYLVAFPKSIVESGADFEQITAAVLSGGTQLVERRATGLTFNSDGSLNLDYTKPSGSLSVSQNGGLYAGTLTITATVSDNVAVDRVEFYVDHELLSTDNLSAFTAVWNTLLYKNGRRLVRAKVFDTSGNYFWISTVVSVANDLTPPEVSIWSPTDGATVSGTIALTAIATDNVAVARVEFYYFDGLGFSLLAIDYSAPYTIPINTKLFDNGPLVLSATAFDTAGNPSAAAFATVNVSNVLEPITFGGDQLTFDGDKLIF